MNKSNFIALAILTRGGGRGGTSKDEGEGSEAGGGVGEGGMRGILCLIKLMANLGETFASTSSSPHGGEIKGLVSSSALPSFL